jgi:hypothetical protein
MRIMVRNQIAKPLIEKSTLSQKNDSESRRWCEYGSSETWEWPHEGGKKAVFPQVMADGIFTRYQGSVYVGTRNEWVIFRQFGWYRRSERFCPY